jgi:hypothetical protein
VIDHRRWQTSLGRITGRCEVSVLDTPHTESRGWFFAIEFEGICERGRFTRSVMVSMNGYESASGGDGNETWQFLEGLHSKKTNLPLSEKNGTSGNYEQQF